MAFQLLGTGASLPARQVSSLEIDQRLGKKPGWLEAECGVTCRFAVTDETQISMALDAAQKALECAKIEPSAIDLIIFASGIGYQTLPSTAPLIQRGLGIADGKAAAFDINSTCLSFVSGLDLAAAYFAAGRYKRALIVSSEIASRALPWDSQPDVAGLFSDGAAAAVVEAAPTGLMASQFETHPSAWEACQIGAGGTRYDFHKERQAFEAHAYFSMDGKALFRITSKHFRRFVSDLLAKAGWQEGEVDVVVPHQASPPALEHLIRQCGFSRQQVVNIACTHGNQIAASIPMALNEAVTTGRMHKGAKVLMLGTSAGVSFGGLAMIA